MIKSQATLEILWTVFSVLPVDNVSYSYYS